MFGGSFDPIHLGHLIVGRAVAEALGLEELRFMPTGEQPLKRGRARGQRRAAGGHGGRGRRGRAGCSRLNGSRRTAPGPSYTVETLRALRAREPGREFVVLLGADAAAELEQWHEVAALPGLARLVAFTRAGSGRPAHPLLDQVVEAPAVEISSTAIRQRVAAGRSIRYLVPDAVAEYIAAQGLYRNGHGMIKTLVKAVFGTQYDREMKKIRPLVEAIKQEEARLASLPDDAIRGQTAVFRARLAERLGPAQAELDEVRQAKHHCEDPHERDQLESGSTSWRPTTRRRWRASSTRCCRRRSPPCARPARRLAGTTVQVTGRELTWDMVHFDVQLIGGIVLHEGKIAEMATGEGKTLVATLPLYLNALAGRDVHLVTVNDYLAQRDAEWMGHVYKLLGMTVGCIHDTELDSRSGEGGVRCDITYGTNNEFGFDYLRDNMKTSPSSRWCSAATTTRSSTRWTRSSSTRRARRSSFPVPPATPKTTPTPGTTGPWHEMVRKQTTVV